MAYFDSKGFHPERWCPDCGKVLYAEEGHAAAVAAKFEPEPGRPPLGAYECPRRPGFFHFGHVPWRLLVDSADATKGATPCTG